MNRIGKFARVAVLSAYLSATLMIPSASAVEDPPPPPAGTVTFSTNYASGESATPTVMSRFIKSLGTQVPNAGYLFSSADTKFLNVAGGTVPNPARLDRMDRDLGAFKDTGTVTIITEQKNMISTGAGTYEVWIEALYTKNVNMMVTNHLVSCKKVTVVLT